MKTLVNEVLPAGEHSVVWDGKDNREIEVCSGVYFYILKVNGKAWVVRKCLMLK